MLDTFWTSVDVDQPRQPMIVENTHNAGWALDFMSDALYRGSRFRTLNVLDEGPSAAE